LRAILESGLPVHLVISHRANVPALAIAQAHGVAARVLLPGDFADRETYDLAVCHSLEEHGVQAVALAGFLRWLTRPVVDRYRGALVNLHPSLLPAYPGLHAIERAFRDRVLWTGVTVHFVDEGHDCGPIIAQSPVPRYVHDTLENLSARLHATEHQLYPQVLQAVDAGRVALVDGRVCYKEEGSTWMHGRS
jgi:phosphoribosylglycinamide formyltransferase-1